MYDTKIEIYVSKDNEVLSARRINCNLKEKKRIKNWMQESYKIITEKIR